MKSNGVSERHQNNNLKAVIAFANFLGTDTTFLDVQLKEQIMAFLDTKIKNVEEDPDKKWIVIIPCWMNICMALLIHCSKMYH
jgi:hypothetical protein